MSHLGRKIFGTMTGQFKLYNTLTRRIEDFKPLQNDGVSLYTCGPTVYNFQHIGNYRCFVFEDVLEKTLTYFGYRVQRVMNITDVGHLTSDEDEGDDKLEVGAKREGLTAWEVAKKYEAAFLDDLKLLKILQPERLIRATDTIEEQIRLIQDLEKKGYTYQTKDGIYFDSTKVADYGKLARLNLEGLRAGERVEMLDKKNPTDFALWKFSPKDIKRDMQWQSPWGIGFPGWHIECSAISMGAFGPSLDIHCGGVDHIPVHHTNEIAQSEAVTGETFAKYWLHSGHLMVDNGKMSKSLGNDYTVQDILDKGYDPLALRLFFYSAHYRTQQNFTWETLKSAQTSLNRLRALAQSIEDEAEGLKEEDESEKEKDDLTNFEQALSDDLNMPLAIAAVWELLRSAISKQRKLKYITKVDQVLSLDLLKREGLVSIPIHVQELVQSRKEARAVKDWSLSDSLRVQIEEAGFNVKDEATGQVLTSR